MRYRIDDLGWFHFEKLVQSLLKAELGLAVENWGGHSDLGRDAYAHCSLPFPDSSKSEEGPFLFQVKFVSGANAAGALWRPPLVKAIRSETKQIERRKESHWPEPRHYVLITNCDLTSGARKDIEAELRSALPSARITSLGGSDVCDLLDQKPELRKSFPEILGLRDLDQLLEESVNHQILERSRAAIAESRDLVPVFVPTQAYHQARASLSRHFFVVLDGPPEMGKTAIARTIAVSYLLNNWQAIDCRDPGDIFSVLSSRRPQIFVADDAFGRTEYDPALGRMWERDLPRIFHCLDARHRLIWTTRKHILIRALREMDITGKASEFPEPGEIIVTASELSTEEKARILYRHSKAAKMSEAARDLVRRNARGIVKNEHFTPERIRRFVSGHVSELADKSSATLAGCESIEAEIAEVIRDPTERMRKSFRKLSNDCKWVLISFLESDSLRGVDALKSRFFCRRPLVDDRVFCEALDDLEGAFLKLGRVEQAEKTDWIHPSYRDLVIDELISNREQREAFLSHASAIGVKLALSEAGGSTGGRQLPLMVTRENWRALYCRCCDIARGGDSDELAKLLDILAAALGGQVPRDPAEQGRIEEMIAATTEIVAKRWDSAGEPVPVKSLEAFFRASDRKRVSSLIPVIEPTWKSMVECVRGEFEDSYLYELDIVADWTKLTFLIERKYEKFSEAKEYWATRNEIEKMLFDRAEEEVQEGAQGSDADSNDSEAQRVDSLAEILSELDKDGSRKETISGLQGLSEDYSSYPTEFDHAEYDRDDYYEAQAQRRRETYFDIEGLFEDL